MNNTDLGARLNLVFEMWERHHGRPLSDEMVAEWLTAAGYPAPADYITALRSGGALGGAPALLRMGLAEFFDVDPGLFAADPVMTHAGDAEVVEGFHNRSLRRLGRVAHGMSLGAMLYLDSLVGALRRAEQLPDVPSTARV
ncbi:hypothetical protein [Nocardia sp. CC227C]|uniref:hypothetical protein n=1 Tax=Nocardia sp. CC227C TaxID=3044562 RepID=UPI00278BBC3E|nr:hypothetical protein [Nocardia sp. CC227C]